jgi:putative hemolysin
MRPKLTSLVYFVVLAALVLTGCTNHTASGQTSAESTLPPLNMVNPASKFCQDQGFTLEIRSEDDGSQYGVCIFSDGSECDEWAYFNGQCQAAKPADTPQPSPTSESQPIPEQAGQRVEGLVGVMVSTPQFAQIDDYFQGMDQNGSRFGIWSRDPVVLAELEALRDSGTVIRIWGTLFTGRMDAYNTQIEVERFERMP